MKKNTLRKIVGAAAALLLSGSFAVAGEYFDLQQGDRDGAVPGRRVLTSRGDAADLSGGVDPVTGGRTANLGGRVLQRPSRQLFQEKPRPKSISGSVFWGVRPLRVCVFSSEPRCIRF